jgi:hypothetical protein
MKKLLVNTPKGTQEIVEIGEGGGYFDQSRVLWDERIDGDLPEITLGGMVRSDSSLVFDQPRMDEHTSASKSHIPQQVTMRQARLALLGAGKLALVEQAIAALPSPRKESAQIEWEYALVVQMDDPLTGLLATALGLTQTEVDALFTAAATL